MVITTKYDLFQEVYLVHDPEQLPRMIADIELKGGVIVYWLRLGHMMSPHYEAEISLEMDEVKKVD